MENDRNALQRKIDSIPAATRKLVNKQAMEIFNNKEMTPEQQKEEVLKLVNLGSSVYVLIQQVDRNLQVLIEEIMEIQPIINMYLRNNLSENHDELIDEYTSMNDCANRYFSELRVLQETSLDISALETLESKIRKETEEAIKLKSRLLQDKSVQIGYKKSIAKPEKEEKKRKFVPKTNVKTKIKRIMAALGASAALISGTVYLGTGIIHGVETKEARGELVESYDPDKNITDCLPESEIKSIYKSLKREGICEELSQEEFLEMLNNLRIDMNTCIQHENTENEIIEDLAGNRLKEHTNKELEYYTAMSRILNNKDLSKLLQGMIKAELAIQISNQTGYRVDMNEVELARHIENGDGYHDNYNYISYETRTGGKVINRSSIFNLCLLDKSRNGRMEATFIDLVDLYLNLEKTDLTKDQLLEAYKGTMAFICNERVVVNEKGKLDTKENEYKIPKKIEPRTIEPRTEAKQTPVEGIVPMVQAEDDGR